MAKSIKKETGDRFIKPKNEAIEVEENVEDLGQERSFDGFVSRYRNLLIGAGAVILLALGGLFYMNYSKRAKSAEARNLMYKAVQYFEQDSLALALEGDGAFPGFLDIESDYSGTSEGNLAKYYMGIIYLKQGDLEQGVAYLESFDKGNNLLSVSAYMAMGFAHEDMGDPATAASYFERAASAVEDNDQTTPKC